MELKAAMNLNNLSEFKIDFGKKIEEKSTGK